MQTILLTIHLVVCLGLIGLVLMQRSEGGALGVGGGGAGSFISGRGAANLLVRLTTIAGIVFFGTSISLSLLGRNSGEERNRSVTDAPITSSITPEQAPVEEPTRAAPASATATATAAAAGAVTIAPSAAQAAERAGPAPVAGARSTETAVPPRQTPAPRTQPPTGQRPAPPASNPPAPVAEAPAPTPEPTAPAPTPTPEPPRQRAGPDQ